MPSRKAAGRSSASSKAANRVEHLLIECVTPAVDGGRYRAKRIVGDVVMVGADVTKEGHDLVSARVLYKGPGDSAYNTTQLTYDGDSDRYFGAFAVDRIGRWHFTVEAWTDVFRTWREGLRKKADARMDVGLELLEGAQLVRSAARRARSAVAKAELTQTAKALEGKLDITDDLRVERALEDELEQLMAEWWAPLDLTRYDRELEIEVDRAEAGFASWYEFFPRSAVSPSQPHGTFKSAAEELPRIADLGFDVVYLPPIHPIGRSFRKGKNNSLEPTADDVGSPWAIGSEAGAHDAVDPRLGSIADFDHFVARTRALGMEVALDYALQCSPDHPWVKEHPDWFRVRPDGSIQYAENPPKKYQDIYPLNFWCRDRVNLWNACRDVMRHWIDHGVKTFRVDNPHTKPLAFWEWLIDAIQRENPEVIFFSEAFTRPKRMKALAKLGFTMSYTYFTWKNAEWEIRQHMEELSRPPVTEYFRGNLFVNTPDILNEYLVHGGRPAFRVRLLLATTLMPLWGMYSGFELIENVPLRAGSEEYLDSEKYEIRPRDWSAPGNLNDDVRLLNGIRRGHPALRANGNLTFHTSENPAILFYRKAGDPDLLVAVNLDPHNVQATMVHVPIREMGLGDDDAYVVRDLLTGAVYSWRGSRNYVRLDPGEQPGHLLRVERA